MSILRFFPIIIGINSYRDTRFERLHFASRDAERMQEFLLTPNPAFKIMNMQVLLNNNAQSTAVKRAIARWVGNLPTNANDLLLLYFAGHGLVTPDVGGQKAYLCCYDADAENPQNGSIGLGDLFHAVQAVSNASVMVITDACESGALLHPGVIARNPAQELQDALNAFIPVGDRGCRILMTAAAVGRGAVESDKLEGGIFTHELLRGWRDHAAYQQGSVTASGLVDYLNRTFEHKGNRPVIGLSGSTSLTLWLPPVPDMPLMDRKFDLTPKPDVHLRDPIIAAPDGMLVGKAAPEERRLAMIFAGVAVVIIALSSLLIATVPLVFTIAFSVAILLAFITPLIAPTPTRALFGLLSLIQLLLLVGVTHVHFGLGEGVAFLDGLGHYAYFAIIIFIIQVGGVIFGVNELQNG